MKKIAPRTIDGTVQDVKMTDFPPGAKVDLSKVVRRVFDGTRWYLYEEGDVVPPEHRFDQPVQPA